MTKDDIKKCREGLKEWLKLEQGLSLDPQDRDINTVNALSTALAIIDDYEKQEAQIARLREALQKIELTFNKPDEYRNAWKIASSALKGEEIA